MKCYYHPEVDAIGICTHCNRGICLDCASDVGGRLACQGIHEDEVRDLDRLVNRSMVVSRNSGNSYIVMILVFSLMGLAFALLGLTRDPIEWLWVIVGIAFGVYAFYNYSLRQKIVGEGSFDSTPGDQAPRS